MIHEVQRERLRICRDCGRTYRIDSTSDRGRHVLAVHIPLNACPACREQGVRWYETAKAGAFDGIYLQDRPEDNYRREGA